MDVKVEPLRRLGTKELTLLNCGARENSWESLVRQEDQSILKEINSEYTLQGLMLKFQILKPPDAKSRLIGKGSNAGKDWRQEEKQTTEKEMVGWHHQLNGDESEQTPGDGEERGKPGVPQTMELQSRTKKAKSTFKENSVSKSVITSQII